MTLELTPDEKDMLSGARGEGAAMALRIVADTARLMSAPSLIPVASAHIDGALYHGDSGTLFAERLVELGAKVVDPRDAECRRAGPDGLLESQPAAA